MTPRKNVNGVVSQELGKGDPLTYIFPPSAIIRHVLNKVAESQHMSMILVTLL